MQCAHALFDLVCAKNTWTFCTLFEPFTHHASYPIKLAKDPCSCLLMNPQSLVTFISPTLTPNTQSTSKMIVTFVVTQLATKICCAAAPWALFNVIIIGFTYTEVKYCQLNFTTQLFTKMLNPMAPKIAQYDVAQVIMPAKQARRTPFTAFAPKANMTASQPGQMEA
jgi:hypothetical protein